MPRTVGEGRVVLVTGASGNIGLRTAEALGKEGWAVALGSHLHPAPAEACAAAIRAVGGKAAAFRADLTSEEEARRLVVEAEAAFGRLDAIVHAAGAFHRTPILSETLEGLRGELSSNLEPLLVLAQAARAGMAQRGFGRIVAFGLAGADHLPAALEITAHAVAKAGVVMLARSLARALAAEGITVNCVCPGLIEGGRHPIEPRLAVRVPAGRLGRAADVVAAVRFFLSEGAQYITGASLPVSGGWELGAPEGRQQ